MIAGLAWTRAQHVAPCGAHVMLVFAIGQSVVAVTSRTVVVPTTRLLSYDVGFTTRVLRRSACYRCA